jgi:hypothetical protein
VLLETGKFRAAAQSMEQALAHSFDVRDQPRYHLLLARVLRRQGQLDEAAKVRRGGVKETVLAKRGEASLFSKIKKVLESAMGMPGVRAAMPAAGKGGVSLQDRVAMYLELAGTYLELDRLPEATKIIQVGGGGGWGLRGPGRDERVRTDVGERRGGGVAPVLKLFLTFNFIFVPLRVG